MPEGLSLEEELLQPIAQRSGTITAVSQKDLDDQLDVAAATMKSVREKGLKAKRVSIGGTSWDGWRRENQDDAATSVLQRAARVHVELDTDADIATAVQQATPLTVRWKPQAPKKPLAGWRTAVLMPDAQRPFVDHANVDLALQITAELQKTVGVDVIVHHGDDLDLPDMSRFISAPDVMGRIQEAIEDQYRILAMERAIAPDAEIFWLEGNHELRLINWLANNAPMLLGLQRAGDKDVEPVLSVPFLCRLDELNVKYLDNYPSGELWLTENIRVIHGSVVKGAKGATAAAYLASGDHSTFYGHIHRQELVSTTKHTFAGPRTYVAGSAGTLCRIDGAVPSTRSGINSRGKQGMSGTEDWQSGIAVLTYEESGRFYNVELVQMWGGWCAFRGKHYTAQVDTDGNPVG